jgi:hypothetical protein
MMGFMAAAVAVPLLLALYLLKLRRREYVVSSTFLWQQAVRDLQVNAPFQRLRRNLLLFLQLAALIFVILSLAGPVLSLQAPATQRTVILMDQSASMNARDGDAQGERTRLEEAKRQARTLIQSLLDGNGLGRRRSPHQIMIIAFARRAQVQCNFTSDRRQLLVALEAIEPTDQEASLREALAVSRAFAQAPGEETNNRSAEDPAQLVLFSDGGIHDLDQTSMGADEMQYRPIGRSRDNVAVTALQARRVYDSPDEVQVFALLANYGMQEASLDIQIRLDGQVAGIRSITLPAATSPETGSTPIPGTRALDVSLMAPGAGLLEVRHLTPDILPADDVAWAVLRVPPKPQVLLVTQDNKILASALRACVGPDLTVETPADFDARDLDAWDAGAPYDIVVLDNVTVSQTPRGSYLILGRPPESAGITAGVAVEGLLAVDWRHRHSILRYVNLTRIFVARSQRWSLPREATVLAEFTEGPVMAVIQREQRVFVWVGFDILESNWPFEPGFVMFCQNALDFLSQQGGAGGEWSVSPGDPVLLEGYPPGLVGRFVSPHAEAQPISADAAGRLRMAQVSRTGVYRIEMPDRPERLLVVNLLNERESNIGTHTELLLGSQTLAGVDAQVQRSNVPLWPWLVVTVLILVCGEWFVYNGRMRFH